MVAAPGLTVIDTPVIDLRYPRDRHFSSNRSFLDRIASEGSAATTIFNLLEVCEFLSFNLNVERLKELFRYFRSTTMLRSFPTARLRAHSLLSTLESSLTPSRGKRVSVTR